MIEIDSKALLGAIHSAERTPVIARYAGFGRIVPASLRPMLASIAGRLRFASLALCAMLAVLGIMLSLAFLELTSRNAQGRALSEGSLAAAELTASIADSRYYASRYAATGDRREIARTEATIGEARQRLAATRGLAIDTDQTTVEAVEWLQVQVEGFESELKALDSSIARYGPSASGDGLARALDVSGEQLAGNARHVERELAAASAANAHALDRFNALLTMLAVALLLPAILIAVVGSRLLSRDIAGSLGQITRAMTGLAAGDRTVAIPGAERGDEIGAMARALAVFRESADQLARLQQDAAQAARGELARQDAARLDQARLMQELAAQFERTVGEVVGGVAAASNQLQDTAVSMAAAADQASDFASEVVQSMDGTSSGVTAAASAGDQFAVSIGEISRQATSSAELARTARTTAEDTDGTIAELNRATEQVGAVVELIRSIAQRTDLLALNASIEAARGGEAGRGFAVVAAEVKDLARRTARATEDVAGYIKGIRQSSAASVAALRKIGQQIRQVESNATTIAQAVDEQTLASRELARNLDLAAGGTESVRGHVGQVGEMALSTGAAATQVLSAANGLQDQATALRFQVDDFLRFVRAA